MLFDPNRFSIGFEGLTGRNSMSLLNARYYERGHFFWDERADTGRSGLQPIQNDVEMGLTLDQAVAVAATEFYHLIFEVFGDESEQPNV